MAISIQIDGFPDYYVSSAGNVWKEKSNDFYLKLRYNKRGVVQLYNNRKVKHMYVYRLIAQAFVPIPSEYADMSIDELEVHHINFNHNDNRASNLQWLTKAEHMQLHSESEITFKRKSVVHKGRPRPEGAGKPPKTVIQYTMEDEYIATYPSASEAARQAKVNHGHICECCRGERNYAGGYKWRYAV